MTKSNDFPSFLYALSDLDATASFAQALAQSLGDKTVIALNGPMGAGKTHLVQFVAEALGIDEVVNSPTFTMLNEYHSGTLPLYHLDLYRLSQADAAQVAPMLFIELTEIFEEKGLVIVEWAELLLRPEFEKSDFVSKRDHLLLEMSYDKNVLAPVKNFKSDLVSDIVELASQSVIEVVEEVIDELYEGENEARKIFVRPKGDASSLVSTKLAEQIGAMVGISMSRI